MNWVYISDAPSIVLRSFCLLSSPIVVCVRCVVYFPNRTGASLSFSSSPFVFLAMPSRTPRNSSRMVPSNAALDLIKKRAALSRAHTYPLSLHEYRASPFVIGVDGEAELEQSRSFQKLRRALASRRGSRYALALHAHGVRVF